MKIKNFYYRTFIVALIILISFVGFHMYNHLVIQTTSFTDEWGRGIEIGEASINIKPLMGEIDGKILILTFSDEGKINYCITTKNGRMVKNGLWELEEFDKNKIQDIYLVGNRLFYVKENILYEAVFNEKNINNNTTKLLENIDGFSSQTVNDTIWINTYNKSHIKLYNLINGELQLINTFDNKWEVMDIQIKEQNTEKYLFVFAKKGYYYNLLAGRIQDKQIGELTLVDEIIFNTNGSIRDVFIEPVEDKFIVAYSIFQMKRGERNTSISLRVVDGNELKVEIEKNLVGRHVESIGNMGEGITLFKDGERLRLLGSAVNPTNKYSSNPDIFVGDVGIDGSLSNVVFLSNTQRVSKNPSLIIVNRDKYIAWLDVEVENYSLVMNSTNGEFKTFSAKFTENDYVKAFLRALTSPFYTLAFIFMKGLEMMLYIIFAFLPIAFIMRRMKIDNEKLKFTVFISVYILLNLLLFKGTYYAQSTLYLMPELLNFSFAPYIMPLLLNIISALALLAFYRDRSKIARSTNYFIYIIFFIAIDMYISALLYVPISMIKVIIG